MTRYVGVDLHRRRSVIVVVDADGTELWTKRIDNNPLTCRSRAVSNVFVSTGSTETCQPLSSVPEPHRWSFPLPQRYGAA